MNLHTGAHLKRHPWVLLCHCVCCACVACLLPRKCLHGVQRCLQLRLPSTAATITAAVAAAALLRRLSGGHAEELQPLLHGAAHVDLAAASAVKAPAAAPAAAACRRRRCYDGTAGGSDSEWKVLW
jgi:hypothetical protein